ncbi:MAG: ABC transporter permease [Oscillospiraceae bacterium]|nr:ABC transporter permease [Oscillospiraceae bacterium]
MGNNTNNERMVTEGELSLPVPGSGLKDSKFSNLSVATKKAFIASAIFILLFIAFSLMRPKTFPTMNNLINLAQQIVTYSIIGFGLTFCLVCGGTDLSAGASGALCGIVLLWLIRAGAPIWLSIVACMGIGLLTGILNGFSIEILGVVPFIATLGTQWLYRGMANVFVNGNPIYTVDAIADEAQRNQFYMFGGGRVSESFPIPYSVFVTVIYGVILAIVLAKTRVGRQIYACGSNLEAAKLSGINAVGTRMFAYCISGLSAAVCGVLVTSRLASAQPYALNGVELQAIAAGVLGGVSNNGGEGTIVNAFIGALVMGTLNNGLTLVGVNSFWQMAIVGFILVGACAIDAYRHRRTTT